MEGLLRRLAQSITRHRGWFIYPQLVLFALCLLFASWRLEFRTDPNDLVSTGQDYLRHWRELKEEFQVQEDLVVLVESDDLEKNRQFVERLAGRLESETHLFKNVFYKADFRALGAKGLLFLPEQRLAEWFRALHEYGPLIQTFSEVTNLTSLIATVDRQLRLASPEQAGEHPLTRALPALTRIVEQGVDSLERTGIPPSPGLTALFSVASEPVPGGYLHFADGRFYVLTCAVADPAFEEWAILRLRELTADTRLEVTGVNVGVTGQPVLRYEEMSQARRDTALAAWLALGVVALTFIYCYHEVARPLKATACLVVGIGYTLGFAALTVGHLNMLTITFIPILIGLGIDFGVHLITRFEEELHAGHTAHTALDRALAGTGTGICTGGVATAAAFLAMTLTGVKGIREMGLICGGGLLVCLVPMMTMLPAVLLRGKELTRLAPPARQAHRGRRTRLEQLWLKRPRTVAGMGLALILLAVPQAYRVEFDHNVLNLQSQRLSAVVYERKMVAASAHTVLSCLVMADSADEALVLERRIRELPSVGGVDSMAPLLAGDQRGKLEWVRQIREATAAIRFAPMDTAPVNLLALEQALASFDSSLGRALSAVHRAGPADLGDDLGALRTAVNAWRRAIKSGWPESVAEILKHYQQALFTDLANTLTALQQQDARTPLRVEDLPQNLRSRFVGRTGKLLLQVYPKENVWERAPQETFVRELRTIDPAVTGTPIRFYEFTGLLKHNFQKSALYALLAIMLLLLLRFRSLVCAMLALLPVLAGTVWTLGGMAILNIAFNPANIIALTLLIGIGVSGGVQILNRFAEQRHASILGKSTGKAVLVSALTTVGGFGSLMIAEHAGIASLGRVMALGTVLCMLAALTVLPVVLLWLHGMGWQPPPTRNQTNDPACLSGGRGLLQSGP